MELAQFSKESEPEIQVIFDSTIEDETNRVKYLCSRYNWYKENGYRPSYPKVIEEKIEKGEDVNEEDIEKSVIEEFDKEKNEKQIQAAKEEWEKVKDIFFENLKILKLPLQEKYYVSITQYGNGGSYGLPNNIQLNFEQSRGLAFTTAHEIVHLTIEHLIQKYSIAHWTKERLVDLVMGKVFPGERRLQRDPENAERINEIFEKEFPDVEKIIQEVSDLNKI